MSEAAFPATAPVVELIGGTPLVDLSELSASAGVSIFGKLEARNPGGSIKDRPALFIVQDAWEALSEGASLVDATSGNTGLAYALLGRALGFPVHLFMPENASDERKGLFGLYGAELTLTPADEGQDGAIERCQAYLEGAEGAHVYADQYSNPANPRAHEQTTGPEILTQAPRRVSHFVAGIGTGGTITGIARCLADQAPEARVIGLQPAEPLHGMEGWKHLETNKRPAVLDETLIHETATVTTMEAWETGARILRELGVALGPSSGANVAACLALAEELDEGTIVTVLPDGLDRYGSTTYAGFVREETAEARQPGGQA